MSLSLLLPTPTLCPRLHRELLRAIVAVRLRIGMRKVRLRALGKAYRLAFPKNKPFNIHKKRCHAE